MGYAIDALETRVMLSDGAAPYILPGVFLSNGEAGLTAPRNANAYSIALDYLRRHAQDFGVSQADVGSPIITDLYTSTDTGITHLYLRQSYGGYEISNANVNFNIAADGRIESAGGAFAVLPSGPAQGLGLTGTPLPISSSTALWNAAAALGLASSNVPSSSPGFASVAAQASTLNVPGLSLDPIPAQMRYLATENGLQLAWEFVLRTPDQEHWYDTSVDAYSGGQLWTSDWVDHASYNVYPQPVESPLDGSRSLVVDPADPLASRYGWHDTNGQAGAEFTDTRGNKVYAQEDADGNNTGGFRPDGGASLLFDFPLDLTKTPVNSRSAGITNLFYWNNLLHDIHFNYGFNEAAGNFQQMDYTGLGLGNDAVQADAEDGSDSNNADFASPPDGQAPRMQMYNWTYASPSRDSALESEVIVHEYGHGVSNRLTGGPSNANALNAIQSGGMGEGWSDWWGLMLTMKASDTKLGRYPIGSWLYGQTTSGGGIRRYPYSYDMTIDPLTFSAYNSSNEVHDAGEIWCSTLWDLSWRLIDRYGFSSDYDHGYEAANPSRNGGNTLALKLVMDALKLQPANPTFSQARDAILQADQILTGGANQYDIWSAFARRGLGASSSSGSSANSTIVTQAFDLPTSLQGTLVTSHSPTGTSSSPIDHVDFKFNKPMNPTSFAIADDVASFTGPGGMDLKAGITGFSWPNSQTLRISFAVVSADGLYTLVVGPQILATDGKAMNQDGDATAGEAIDDRYSASFRYDSSILGVAATNPPVNGLSPVPMTALQVHFTKAYDPASIGINDLSLSSGTITGFTLIDSTTVRYALSGLTAEGTLTVTMAAGAVNDAAGNLGGAFSASYYLDNPTLAIPTPLKAVDGVNGFVYTGSVSGLLTPGDTDSFTINLDAGQTLTVAAGPATSLFGSVSVTNPSGVVSGPVSAPAAGKDAVLQTVTIAAAGVYTISIASLAGTSGTYSLQLLLNAATEAELHDGVANDSRATAQDISSAVNQVAPGVWRGAVVGSGGVGAGVILSSDFSAGANGFTVDNTGGGLWHLSPGHGSEAGHSPTQSFYYGTGESAAGGGTYNSGSTNHGALISPSFAVPATGPATVSFNYILKTEASSSYDKAQLQINSGAGWITLASYNAVAESTTWKAATPVSLTAYAGKSVQLRFYFDTVDSGSNSYEGWYVDDVVVKADATGTDYYSMNLVAGQPVSLALATLAGSASHMVLQDALGSVLASGVNGAANYAESIQNFVPSATGVYYAVVTGNTGWDYALTVTMNAVMDVEANDSLATAQPLGTAGGAMGMIGVGGGTSNFFDGFETGTLGASWSAYSSDAVNGRIRATNTNGAASGTYALLMDTASVVGAYNLNEAILTVNLAGATSASLSFATIQFADETNPLTADFSGHFNGDGVAISSDGVRWHPVLSAPADSTWKNYTINLVTEAAKAGMTLGSSFKIKFQQYDNFSLTTDGRGWDNVTVSANIPVVSDDYYSFTVLAGAVVNLTTLTPGSGDGEFANAMDPALDLYDPMGVLVASDDNSAADGRNAFLSLGITPGTWKVRVRGVHATTGEYLLVRMPDLPLDPTPLTPDLTAASDTGLSSSDNITRLSNSSATSSLSFTIGNTFPGATVVLYADSVAIASAMASGLQTTMVTDGKTPLSDGIHRITAIQTLPGKDPSPTSPALAITIMTASPAAPAPLQLQSFSDTGFSDGDRITSVKTPVFNVAAGPYYRVYRGAALISQQYESAAAFTSPVQADGTWSLFVTSLDVAGNESDPSPALAVTIDTVAPAAPAAPDLESSSDSGVSQSDNITNVDAPLFDITAGPFYRLYRGALLLGGAYDTAGTYLSPALSNGSYAFTVISVDAAGNASAASSPLSVTIDTIAPAQPAEPDLLSSSDGGGSDTDNITNDNTPSFSVAGAPYFRFLRDGAQVSGDFASGAIYTANPQPDGTYAYSLVSVDAAGNASTPSADLVVTIDSTILLAPTLIQACDTGLSASDGITSFNNNSPAAALVFTVPNAIPGATVRLYANGQLIASTIATGPLAFLIADGATALPDKTYRITATQQLPGNVESTESFAAELTIDTIAPTVAMPDLNPVSDSGLSATDNITNVSSPLIDIGAAYYSLYVDGAAVRGPYQTGQAQVDLIGDGVHAVTAIAWDIAGNVSPISDPLLITLVTATPATPSTFDLDTSSDTGLSSTDNITSDNTPTFNIVAGPNYRVLRGGTLISGLYEMSPTFTPSAQPDGTHLISLRAADIAGNLSPAVSLSITIDTVAPAIPPTPDLDSSTDSGLSGTDNITNSPLLKVSVLGSDLVRLFQAGVQITPEGQLPGILSVQSPADAIWAYTAQAVDLAGNASGISSPLNVTLDTVAPPIPVAPDLQAGSDTGTVSTDNITNATSPAFTIAPNPYARFYRNGIRIGSDYAPATTFTATAQTDGTWSYSVSAIDAAGNESPRSPALSVTIDTLAPAAPPVPDLPPRLDSGLSNSDNITNVSNPGLDLSAAERGRLHLFVDGSDNPITVSKPGTISHPA
jgi:hypothetical protein